MTTTSRRSSAPVPIDRQTIWRAFNEHAPELVPLVREIAERFGVDAVSVKPHGQAWQYWRRSR